MLILILLLLLCKSSQQVLLWLYDLSLKNFIIALNQRNLLFRHVLLVGCTRSSMRCCTSYTIHINVPFITNDNYLFSIIRLFSSLLLLWDLVNNHLFDGRLFPFFGLLSRTHLSFIIPFCLRILLSSFLNDLLLFRWHNMFVIIFIGVSHPSLLFILCLYSWRSSNSFL